MVADMLTKPLSASKIKYFITSVGCGIAGYKVEEIAPMFKGISHNVIFPQSFRPFVEKALPKITSQFLHTIFRDSVIFTPATDELIDVLALTDNEKSLAKILLNTQIYPVDSNGRDRVFAIEDILHNLNGKIFDFQNNSEGSMLFGAVILALLELYNINEKDFIDVWKGDACADLLHFNCSVLIVFPLLAISVIEECSHEIEKMDRTAS